MKCASLAIAMVSFVVALLAAWYWSKASGILPAPIWARLGLSEPGDATASMRDEISGQSIAISDSGALNKKAAGLTALSVLLSALSTILASADRLPCFQ